MSWKNNPRTLPLNRACRLKKKAQHEANKIKLYGLEQEHRGILTAIEDVRNSLLRKVEMGPNGVIPSPSPHPQSSPGTANSSQAALTQHIEKLYKLINSKYIDHFHT